MKWFMGEKEPLVDAHDIRHEVFCIEQNCPHDEEFDYTDDGCVHLVMYDDGLPVATGRILLADDYYKIGRVATIMTHRGRGIATALMQTLIGACVAMGGENARQLIHAQIAVQSFYEKLGFVAFGEEFEEAGIPHIAMERFGHADSDCGGSQGCCGSGGRHHASGSVPETHKGCGSHGCGGCGKG